MKNNRQHRLISTAILMFILVMITALLPVSTQEVQAAKKAKTYKITYKLNGGKNNAKNVKKLKKGKSLTLKNPTRKGYTFKGWYTSKSLKKGKISRIRKIKKSVTVYAKWSKQPTAKKSSGSTNNTTAKPSQPTEYTIVYNLNGGMNNPKNPKTVKAGQLVQLYEPTREGYDFVNWYYDAAFTASKATNYVAGITGRYTVYAKWVKMSGGTETTEPEKPSEPTDHTHNYNIPVKGPVNHNEIFCSGCNTLLSVATNTNGHILQPGAGQPECAKYTKCPSCGKSFTKGEVNQRNQNHTTVIIYAYKCSCGDIQYRTDYDWHKEYQCPTGEHKPVN